LFSGRVGYIPEHLPNTFPPPSEQYTTLILLTFDRPALLGVAYVSKLPSKFVCSLVSCFTCVM